MPFPSFPYQAAGYYIDVTGRKEAWPVRPLGSSNDCVVCKMSDNFSQTDPEDKVSCYWILFVLFLFYFIFPRPPPEFSDWIG